MIEFAPALALGVIATAMDLRWRRVPNWLVLCAVVLGLGLAAWQEFPDVFLLRVWRLGGAFLLGYLLCIGKAWAPGDLKLYLGLVALMPLYPDVWGLPSLLVLPAMAFGLLIVVFLPLAGLFALIVRGNGYTFRQVFMDTLRARVPFAPFLLGGLLVVISAS